jgi:hypothetical protein
MEQCKFTFNDLYEWAKTTIFDQKEETVWSSRGEEYRFQIRGRDIEGWKSLVVSALIKSGDADIVHRIGAFIFRFDGAMPDVDIMDCKNTYVKTVTMDQVIDPNPLNSLSVKARLFDVPCATCLYCYFVANS